MPHQAIKPNKHNTAFCEVPGSPGPELRGLAPNLKFPWVAKPKGSAMKGVGRQAAGHKQNSEHQICLHM
jgi:hypothetical protein